MSNHTRSAVNQASKVSHSTEAFDTSQVVTISAGHAVHDTYSAFLPPLLPELIQRFSLTNAEAGLLSAIQQVPSILQPVIGYLADRISLRYLVILAPGITATVMSLLGIAPTYAVIVFLLLIAGLSSAGMHAIGPVMSGRVSGDRIGRGMSFWMVGGEMGRTVGPILVVSAIAWFGLEGIVWLMLGGWVTSILLYFRMRQISGKPPDPEGSLHWREVLIQMRPFIIALVMLQVVRSFSSVALTTYLPVFLKENGASLWWAGTSLSILEAAGVVGALVGGSLSDRLGRRRVLATAMLLTSVLIILFLYTVDVVRTLLLPLLGFFSLSITPIIMAIVQESYPENRAMANGVYMALSFILRSLILVIFGAVSDSVGLSNAYLLSAILLVVGIPVVRLFPVRGQSM